MKRLEPDVVKFWIVRLDTSSPNVKDMPVLKPGGATAKPKKAGENVLGPPG